jgi:hypothetical protein
MTEFFWLHKALRSEETSFCCVQENNQDNEEIPTQHVRNKEKQECLTWRRNEHKHKAVFKYMSWRRIGFILWNMASRWRPWH